MENLHSDDAFRPELFLIATGLKDDKDVIWLRFDYSKELYDMLKKHTPAKWSPKEKSWYMTDKKDNRILCNLPPKIVGQKIISKISEHNHIEFIKFQNLLKLKGFSFNTLRSYSIEFAQLLYVLKEHHVDSLEAEKLQSYFLYCINDLHLSENLIHSRMNAIKFYFEKVLHKDKMFFNIPRPKKPERLAKTLTSKDLIKIFKSIENEKHKIIIQLCYGMGLRVSEIVNIKIEDINSVDMRVHIRDAKGKKDRFVNLPDSILISLREYYKTHKPKSYLFENRFGDMYTTRSIQKIFKDAMLKAKISKSVGIHGLRHSYATHLLEVGTDISLIQKLLGHNDIKTTLNYTKIVDKHIKNVKSPLDKLM